MKRVLWLSDSPTCTTGFGKVAMEMLRELTKLPDFEFHVFGINYYGDPYNREEYPYAIWPAASAQSGDGDVYGRKRFLEKIRTMQPDIVFILQDTFIVQTMMPTLLKLKEEAKNPFKVILYFPIDCPPKKEWVTECVSKIDFPVVYTKYGREECAKIDPSLANMAVIYHGTNKKDFFPAPLSVIRKFREAHYGPHAEKFIVLNVNRNQPRKDLVRTFDTFSQFHRDHPKSFLYILAQAMDVGGNLIELAEQFGLVYGEDWSCPPPGSYAADHGVKVESVNLLYNSADLVISTTLGEGWGLSVTEAMACKVPVLFPRNTSLMEIIGENEERGFLASCGGSGGWICLGPQDNNRIRPVVDVKGMARKMALIRNNPGLKAGPLHAAYAWVPDWGSVCDQWKKVFLKAAEK